jgi:RNA polymerase sigma-70 factor (ECF subfamily)
MGMEGTRLSAWLAWGAPREEVDWDAAFTDELPRVLNFFRYRIGDPATAEDLTSLTFEKAWRARAGYRRGRAAVSTWLLAIARNVAIDHFRRPRLEARDEHRGHEAEETTPEDLAVRRQELERLGLLLRGLPARERELIALKYGAGATNRAIAKLTGLSESNVGTILHRTVGELRAEWNKGERS